MDLTGLLLAAPSTVTVGEQFSFGMKVLTQPYFVEYKRNNTRFNLSPRGILYMDNVPKEWRGTITIEGGDGYAGPRAYSFAEGKRPLTRIGPVSFKEAGVKSLTLRDKESGMAVSSNPILVSSTSLKKKLFWGDIHCHTYLSDGVRSPEQVCAFARKKSFLDIFAITDHNGVSPRQWEYSVGVSNDFYEPGRFVTLIGQECEHWHGGGHVNIYYPGDKGSDLSHRFGRGINELMEDARKHKALLIPHHTAATIFANDWSMGHEPDLERLVEIHSVWGNSERPERDGNTRPIRCYGGEKDSQHVIDGLRRGYRFGLIGGGDIHDGRPGDELHTGQEKLFEKWDYHKLHRQGIMGVWAKELTREAVFEALWNRRVFATSNVRVYLTFHVCGGFMGSEIKHKGPRPIEVHAISEVPFASAEIMRNGDDIFHIEPHEKELKWEVEDKGTKGSDWYYVRLTREDGENAWSSPVWVDS